MSAFRRGFRRQDFTVKIAHVEKSFGVTIQGTAGTRADAAMTACDSSTSLSAPVPKPSKKESYRSSAKPKAADHKSTAFFITPTILFGLFFALSKLRLDLLRTFSMVVSPFTM